MGSSIGHRKWVKHYHQPGHCHELTFSCFQRLPLLTHDQWRQMLSVCIDRANAGHGFRLAAFVYMPEHVHLLVYPMRGTYRIDALLKAIKQPFSNRIRRVLEANRSPLLDELTVRESSGKRVFHFWQQGPGYDRNLETPHTVEASIQYIQLNPVRRGLVSCALDYRWSSCRFYEDSNWTHDEQVPAIHSLPAEYLQR